MNRACLSRRTPSRQTLASATLLNGVNLLLLMPAARHEHAGMLTQALPHVILGLTLVLFVVGTKRDKATRK